MVFVLAPFHGSAEDGSETGRLQEDRKARTAMHITMKIKDLAHLFIFDYTLKTIRLRIRAGGRSEKSCEEIVLCIPVCIE